MPSSLPLIGPFLERLLALAPQGVQDLFASQAWLMPSLIMGSVVFGLAYAVFWVMMIVHAVRRAPVNKPAWVALIALTPPVGLVPPIGALVYYLAVRSKMPDTVDLKPAENGEAKPPGAFTHALFVEYYGGVFFFLITAFVGAALYTLRPMIIEIKETEAQIGAQQQAVDAQQRVLDVLDRSVNAAQTIESDTLDKVDLALPTDPGYPYMLADLSAAAARNGVRINSISFSAPKANANPNAPIDPTKGTVVPVDATMSLKAARYFDLKRFLADVEANLRVMDVVAIGLSSSQGGSFDYTLQLRSYIFVPPGVKPPAE